MLRKKLMLTRASKRVKEAQREGAESAACGIALGDNEMHAM
jgi:hypothetical protein